MHEIQKKILTDENAKPVAVQIDYADWLEIERRLAANGDPPSPEEPPHRGNLKALVGSIRWGEDAVAYQRRVREEWPR